MKRRPRIFLGLREIAGYSGRLKKGIEENKVKCTLLDFHGDSYRHNPDFIHPVSIAAQKLQKAARLFSYSPAGFLCRLAVFLLRTVVLTLSLWYVSAFLFIFRERI